ncbi:ABC transporter substrate-binding protein [Roseomonas marmotae]|uniref:ABC transporter substrate-binding protein n=1 Tax=Roseomonas marmotae TaxID=2768161 RepID=UPI001F237893|nr:ABC transporter substrate-binding protein [Roseomonas marmotae]
MTAVMLSRRALLASSALMLLPVITSTTALAATPGDKIRKISLLCAAQASDPQEFQAAQLIASAWRQLGLDVEVKGLPRPQLSDIVWNNRTKWDMTMWRMVGRPERSDPDEFTFNLYNPSTIATGYNFVGYDNPDFQKIAEEQRAEPNLERRQELLYEAQEIIDRDQPYLFLVYPKNVLAYDKSIWKPESIVEQSGIGIRCFWTFLRAEPAGAKRDMVVNAAESLIALNPLYISGAIDSWVTELIWDRLMRVGPDGLPQPWAAEKVTQVDPTTIDVVLRAGQTWHDGKPVTVEDVVFSFEAPATSDKSPMYKPFVANIDSVKAVDERTVRFVLKTPSSAFATSTLAKINLVPRHVWQPILADLASKPQNAETVQEERPIGSGPFKVSRFKLNEEIVLEANPQYWEKPRMDRWIMRVITNTGAAMSMLPRGEINFLTDYRGDPKLLADMAKGNPNIEVVATTDMGFRFAAPNFRRPPFNDARFRRALSLAINRQLMAAAAWNGFATPANSFVSPALKFWSKPGIDDLKVDMAAARKLLEEAGYVTVRGKLHYPEGVKETLTEG